jgi:release factor glutamine methyltransferase
MTNASGYAYAIKLETIEAAAIRLLLCHINGYASVSELFLNWDKQIKDEQYFNQAIMRLVTGEPLQYVINQALFMGDAYYVDENVLIPRPETETIVEEVSSYLTDHPYARFVDLGTGSGCIAISLKKKFPHLVAYATDISETALEVAKRNANEYKSDITFLQGDWLAPLIRRNIVVDLIISNPPYIASKATVASNVLEHEPHLALFAKDGIDNHRIILMEARKVLAPQGLILLEIDENQTSRLFEIATATFKRAKIEFVKDLQGKSRFIKIQTTI